VLVLYFVQDRDRELPSTQVAVGFQVRRHILWAAHDRVEAQKSELVLLHLFDQTLTEEVRCVVGRRAQKDAGVRVAVKYTLHEFNQRVRLASTRRSKENLDSSVSRARV